MKLSPAQKRMLQPFQEGWTHKDKFGRCNKETSWYQDFYVPESQLWDRRWMRCSQRRNVLKTLAVLNRLGLIYESTDPIDGVRTWKLTGSSQPERPQEILKRLQDG